MSCAQLTFCAEIGNSHATNSLSHTLKAAVRYVNRSGLQEQRQTLDLSSFHS